MARGYRKYHNKPVVIDGIKFDSAKEGDYYLYLKQLQERGEISSLQLQVPFEIIPAVYGEKVTHLKTKDRVDKYCIQRATYYVADFVYEKDGNTVVEDTKGFCTPDYILKRKLMLLVHGIKIQEVKISERKKHQTKHRKK